MTAEAVSYALAGAGAVGGASFLMSRCREAWNQCIEAEIKRRAGTGALPAASKVIAEAVAAQLRPELIRLEAKIGGETKTPTSGTIPAQHETKPPAEETKPAKAETDWRKDKELLQHAKDCAAALHQYGMGKKEAEAVTMKVMDRIARPGLTFNQLFTEAVRKENR